MSETLKQLYIQNLFENDIKIHGIERVSFQQNCRQLILNIMTSQGKRRMIINVDGGLLLTWEGNKNNKKKEISDDEGNLIAYHNENGYVRKKSADDNIGFNLNNKGPFDP